MRFWRFLASLTLSLASGGVSMLVAAFLFSALGNQRGAALAFQLAAGLLGLFGVPGLQIWLCRARKERRSAPETAPLSARVEAELRELGFQARQARGPDGAAIVCAVKAGVRVVLRCEAEGKESAAEAVLRAAALRKLYAPDMAGLVSAAPFPAAAAEAAQDAGLLTLAPGRLRAMYPRAHAIWCARRAKRHALHQGLRARAAGAQR
ncbi:MAG: hypothetical protein AB7L65_06555 [Hyphomonadaceae bacterium]